MHRRLCLHTLTQQGSLGIMCQNVITSPHIQVLYAYTGDFDDPSASAVITGLQYTYSTEDIAALVSLHLVV